MPRLPTATAIRVLDGRVVGVELEGGESVDAPVVVSSVGPWGTASLARHGLPAQHLTLELTETAALAGSGEGLEMIGRLRDLGVNIAIDDYGTGLSTLDYLKKIPANEIKIDQSFVKGIADNRSDRLMVQSTVGLAHSLGRKVVAEGVEHRDILDLLVEMGCDIAQGFAVGRPMVLESLTKRLLSDRKRTAA